MDAVFDKWCEKLLDTGRGNRLINYKDSKLRTIEILAPSIYDVFEKVSKGDTLAFFDVDSYIKKLKDDAGATTDESDQTFDKINKQQIYDALSWNLKKNQILSYKKGFTLKKVLGTIKKIASSSLAEKGINILYLAFGFLNWRDPEKSDESYCSPLVLIPITLANEGSSQPFTIAEYDDEINTNPTLIYKLKNEYGITLPEFREATFEDESITSYFDRVRWLVERHGWTVKEDMAIGTFSFLKLNMYKDLKENENKILENNTIKKLLNKKVEEIEEDSVVDIEECFKNGIETSLHNVVDADSSQMASIIQAKNGKSFVLQGPPGTGKSQTITNLIAEFLNDGKKILFVSEKLAALNVVFNNLKKAGLSDFCLELHSNKTNKKDVIAELYRVLNRTNKTVNADAKEHLNELKLSKEQLDKYAEVMHTVQPCIGKTPFEIIGEISKNLDAPTFEYAIDSIQTKDAEFLDSAVREIESCTKYTDAIGFDYHKNPWYGYQNEDTTYQGKLNVKNMLKQFTTYLDAVMKNISKLNEELQIDIHNFLSLFNSLDFVDFVPSMKFFDSNIFDIAKIDGVLNSIKKYNEDVENLQNAQKAVAAVYTDEIYELNLNEYYLNFKTKYISIFRFLNGNYQRDKKVLAQYQIDSKQKLKYQAMVELLKNAKNVIALKSEIIKDEENIFKLLRQDKQDMLYDWKTIETEVEKLKGLLTAEFGAFAKMTKQDFERAQKCCLDFIKFYNAASDNLAVLSNLQEVFDKEIIDFKQFDFEELYNKLKSCLDNFDNLENWIRFFGVLNNLKKLNLQSFLDKSIELSIERKTLDKTFKLMFYTQWIYYIISQNDILRNFNRLSQDAAVATFKKKDKLKFEISKAEVVAKVTAEMPDPNNMATGGQVHTLVREANKKSKQRPVRLLLRDIGELVQKLKPCFLMSPLSVSTYLDSDTCKFDVVIFDEASQIFPWDAIGAISRAKQVIVVGDSKQMPPSNFFSAGMVDEDMDEDDYDDDTLDFESILDLCATVFPQNRLNWHYRSKTEDLISFSNRNFYDGKLVTFPSAHKDNGDTGVEFFYVENGQFDRKTKRNIVEAERVVDLVFDHFKKHPERSLGVVAFSISQQDAIEDAIQKRREKDDKFAEFFDTKRQEPFFVKNLETVQGDERDTIIFSVAYARDAQGRFLHNFGPLNKKGGERRLNVAVTRAKYNVKLVSSIKSHDIDLGKTSAVGAKLLKSYLDYAEHGADSVKNIVDTEGKTDSSFELEIYDVLKNEGYKVDLQVGCSDYKIDLGVRHPNRSDYVLAIECDGKTYHSGKTTRDRDRLRQEVLEKLGWKFYRIWSADWFMNKPTEKRKLLEAVKKSIENFDKQNDPVGSQPKQQQQDEKESFIVEEKIEKKDLKSQFKRYKNFDINAHTKKPTFYNTIYPLVEAEAPITEELLLKKMVKFFGREKVTSAVKEAFRYQMRYQPNIFKVKDFYTTDKNMKIELRIPKDGDEPRDIMMISNAELSAGMYVIIKNNVGITKDGLFYTLRSLLGFSRMGANILAKLNESLDELLKDKKIKLVNGEYFIA